MLSNSKKLDFQDKCYHVYHDKIHYGSWSGESYRVCKKCGYWKYE